MNYRQTERQKRQTGRKDRQTRKIDRQTYTTNIDRKYRKTEKSDREIRHIDRIEKADSRHERQTYRQTDKQIIDIDFEVRICASLYITKWTISVGAKLVP